MAPFAEIPPAIVAAVIALVATVVGAVIAVGWPTWRSRQTGRRFLRLIRRELQEIGPHVPDDDPAADKEPWWHYLSKRFVHEEFLTRQNVAAHRDFILTLDPTVVYLVSQLWIAYEKRDFQQWLHFLSMLAANSKVGTKDLRKALANWRRIPLDRQASLWVRGAVSQLQAPVEKIPDLFSARLHAYCELMTLLEPATVWQSRARLTQTNGEDGTLRSWYGHHGLLLSGESLHRYIELRDLLSAKELGDPEQAVSDLHDALSALRTELKIDLGVRHPDERDEPPDYPRSRW